LHSLDEKGFFPPGIHLCVFKHYSKEGFPALLPYVRLLSSVNPFMYCKVTRRTKDFPALLANKGFLFSVRAFMYLRGKGIIEGYPTLLIFVASLSTVSSIIFLKTWKTGGFSTFLTFI
jgi:hypothetical protein